MPSHPALSEGGLVRVVCVCVPLPLCIGPVSAYLQFFVVLGSCAHSYNAALDGCLLNLVYFLLERATASVHGTPAPLNF